VIYAAGIIPGTLKVILAQPPISPNAIWNISCNPATAFAADIKGKKGPPIKDYINIGVQDNSASILYEGKPIPRALKNLRPTFLLMHHQQTHLY
jgi:hypothetical protein